MENNLKKEFNKRDVQRMRNIITGKAGDKTQIQAGWEVGKGDYKEGDVWVEDGKKWTIKNGIKQSVTKLDAIKKMVMLPLTCPNCGSVIKVTDIEKKMWSIHKTCFDCVLKKEAEIRRQGKWEEYENSIMEANRNAILDNLESALEEWYTQDDTFVTEAGDVEAWNGGNKSGIYKQVKNKIAELKSTTIYKENNQE